MVTGLSQLQHHGYSSITLFLELATFLLKAVDRIQRQLELQAKLLGELQQEGTINVTVSPEWVTLRAVILSAVTPYPDAAKAISAALSVSTRGVGSDS